MIRFTMSIDFDSTIDAENEDQALEKAEQMIKDRAYTILIVDKEPTCDEECPFCNAEEREKLAGTVEEFKPKYKEEK